MELGKLGSKLIEFMELGELMELPELGELGPKLIEFTELAELLDLPEMTQLAKLKPNSAKFTVPLLVGALKTRPSTYFHASLGVQAQ